MSSQLVGKYKEKDCGIKSRFQQSPKQKKKKKKVSGMAQVLPSKHKCPEFNPQFCKNNKYINTGCLVKFELKMSNKGFSTSISK
jgi:hypothetical protein